MQWNRTQLLGAEHKECDAFVSESTGTTTQLAIVAGEKVVIGSGVIVAIYRNGPRCFAVVHVATHSLIRPTTTLAVVDREQVIVVRIVEEPTAR